MLGKYAISALALSCPVCAMAAINAGPMLYEEQLAHQEERLIIQTPIAGIENDNWFNYRNNVTEAKHELQSDLDRASDTEDRRDAWGEYRHELNDERVDYVKAMAEEGYRYPSVRIIFDEGTQN